MPLHPDFQKVRDSMREQYGKKKGDEIYYSYLSKNDLDDTKAMPKKVGAEADDLGRDTKENPDSLKKPKDVGQNDGDIAPLQASLGEPNEDEDEHIKDLKYERVTQIQPVQQVLHNPDKSLGGGGISPDQHDNIEKAVGTKEKEVLNHEDSLKFAYPPPAKGQTLKAAVHIPAFKFRYSASPIEGSAGDMLISALVLEPGQNINGWEVDNAEFDSVARQYGEGRQLRTNHSANVEQVFGKSYEGKILLGKDVSEFLGYAVEGILPEATYVGARFKATPKNEQVRINLEKGYVDTGSIGLDANAYCKQCNLPVEVAEDGSVSRTCNHLTASVILRNVDVKEYSYVAEPAFSHSKIFPSFAAAVNSALKSSLMQSSSTNAPMSTVQAKADAKGKADADAGNTLDESKTYSQAEADAYADAKMKIFKDGMAYANKFRAKDGDGQDGDGQDGDGNQQDQADAAAKMAAQAAGGFKDQPDGGVGKGFAPMKASKTDQIGRTNQRSEMKAAKDDLISRVLRPTQYAINADPALKELFTAAANAPGAPLSVKQNVKGVFG